MSHQTFTRVEVAENNTEGSLWFVIDSKVYDVTDFLDAHPGGEAVLKQVAGQDATDAFYNLHRQEVLQVGISRAASSSVLPTYKKKTGADHIHYRNTLVYALVQSKARSRKSLSRIQEI